MKVEIKAKHVPPLCAGHPWVFAQAIARVNGSPGPGDVVAAIAPDGRILGRGFFSPKSAIPLRLLTSDAEPAEIDESLLRGRLQAAIALRTRLGLPSDETTGYRLVNAEGDGLPGLVVDCYGRALVVRFATVGMQMRSELWVRLLAELCAPEAIVQARGDESQAKEGLQVAPGLLLGSGGPVWPFRENGFTLSATLPGSQKTGYYFDQRDNRRRVGRLTAGRSMLDLFCYVGGFALAAARHGATRVVAVDSSQPALDAGATHARENQLGDRIQFVRDDVKQLLAQKPAGDGERFDVVVLDPPKLVHDKQTVERARRVYRTLNAQALSRVAAGGILCTCSCSGRLPLQDFLRLIGLAAGDARRRATVVHVGGAGGDHPVPPAFDQGRYLKCVVLAVE